MFICTILNSHLKKGKVNRRNNQCDKKPNSLTLLLLLKAWLILLIPNVANNEMHNLIPISTLAEKSLPQLKL